MRRQAEQAHAYAGSRGDRRRCRQSNGTHQLQNRHPVHTDPDSIIWARTSSLPGPWDLAAAMLADADLTDANLMAADLERATLTDANLTGANLMGMNLRAARCNGANLTGANLLTANLRATMIEGAILANANLDSAERRAHDPVPRGWRLDTDSGRLQRASTSSGVRP